MQSHTRPGTLETCWARMKAINSLAAFMSVWCLAFQSHLKRWCLISLSWCSFQVKCLSIQSFIWSETNVQRHSELLPSLRGFTAVKNWDPIWSSRFWWVVIIVKISCRQSFLLGLVCCCRGCPLKQVHWLFPRAFKVCYWKARWPLPFSSYLTHCSVCCSCFTRATVSYYLY